MSAPAKLLTYNEVLELPDLGEHYELIDGVLVVPAAPSWRHANLVAELFAILHSHVRTHRPLGTVLTAPVDVRFTDLRVLQPDIVYISPERRHLLTEDRAINGAPDLVIEVLSPFNRSHDLVTKFGIYEQAGVREYWIADRDRETLITFALQDGRFVEQSTAGGLAHSVVLPGLEVDLAILFADLRTGFSG